VTTPQTLNSIILQPSTSPTSVNQDAQQELLNLQQELEVLQKRINEVKDRITQITAAKQ
jgi:hypothetical protein